ncbi:hypothetical protein R6Q59_001578 [Mikania micrantha]
MDVQMTGSAAAASIVPAVVDISFVFEEKKPYKTFAKWAETYGSIYSIKMEATSMVAINSNDISKEKKHHVHRDTLAENLSNRLHDLAPNSHLEAVNLRKIFQSELFTLAMKQILVLDPLMGAIEVEWRAVFPYLSWILNKSFETKIEQMCIQREDVNVNSLLHGTKP